MFGSVAGIAVFVVRGYESICTTLRTNGTRFGRLNVHTSTHALATSADRTFSERKGRGSAHFLYDKLHMKPSPLKLFSCDITLALKNFTTFHLLLYDSILVMSPRILL